MSALVTNRELMEENLKTHLSRNPLAFNQEIEKRYFNRTSSHQPSHKVDTEKPFALPLGTSVTKFRFDSKLAFSKPISLLLDRETSSTAEILVDLLENHPYVKTY